MSSISYSYPIYSGKSQPLFSILNPYSPGGAIRGYMPPWTANSVDKSYSDYENNRSTIKESFNTHYLHQLKRHHIHKPIITPFRAIMNAGDLLCREAYSCGGPTPPSSRPNVPGLKSKLGSIGASCRPSYVFNTLQLNTSIPAANCNPKYVYDSSDYTKFKKLMAMKKNYNDLTYGGKSR